MVEAQAAGCPVIAYKGGGALETVIDGVTGIFFAKQSAASLVDAVRRFEQTWQCFHSHDLMENAERFSKARFKESFLQWLTTR
jgi:glycosyltransferase involved in cell wall biosynthesis